MSTGKFKRFEQHRSGFNLSLLRASPLESNAVFRRFLAAFLDSKMRSRTVCSLSFLVSTRDGSSQEECYVSCLTTDSLDRPFIQGLFRRLHPGGTTVKWILSTFVKPGSVDTVLQ